MIYKFEARRMTSRILLINFEKKDAEKLKGLNVVVDRGYLAPPSSATRYIYLYFPHPVYEYKVVIANLNSNQDLYDEFKDKLSYFDDKIAQDFFRCRNKKKTLFVIFLGDYGYNDLNCFGIDEILLEDTKAEDISVIFNLAEKTAFRRALKEFMPQIDLPARKYVSIPETSTPIFGRNLLAIYTNRGGYILGCYLDTSNSTDVDQPSYVILPQFKYNHHIILRLLREFGNIYPKFLAEFYEPNWMEGEKYYPKTVRAYDKQIADYEQKMKNGIKELLGRKQQTKEEYEDLRSILYKKGDELKETVKRVLEKYWSLRVIDMDKEGHKSLKEDLLIEEGTRKILTEVKGTDKPYPSPTFLTQAWKHLQQSGLGSQAEAALVLNYDIKTDPEERNLAYTSEDEEKQLKDLVFIDTRDLFHLTIATLDYGLSLEEAKKKLLGKGRVKFNIARYKKSKTSR